MKIKSFPLTRVVLVICPEAATWGFLLEKVFLKNSKNLQENPCARDSLETVPESLKRLWHSPQRDSGTGVFL